MQTGPTCERELDYLNPDSAVDVAKLHCSMCRTCRFTSYFDGYGTHETRTGHRMLFDVIEAIRTYVQVSSKKLLTAKLARVIYNMDIFREYQFHESESRRRT